MGDLEGNINIGAQNGGANTGSQNPNLGGDELPQNTLDEPVMETIKRDLRMITYKLKYVMNPKARQEGVKELRNFISILTYRGFVGTSLALLGLSFVFFIFQQFTNSILSIKASDSADTIFGTIFIIVWGGASVLTLNAKFLGGQASFFQSVCVLGYCIFPILLAAGIITILEIFFQLPFVINMALCGGALFWAVTSAVGFMQALVSEQRKILAVYPVLLFYLSLSWFVLIAASED